MARCPSSYSLSFPHHCRPVAPSPLQASGRCSYYECICIHYHSCDRAGILIIALSHALTQPELQALHMPRTPAQAFALAVRSTKPELVLPSQP